MKKINLFLLFISPLLITSCEAITGKEIGRLPINELSLEGDLRIKETKLELSKDDEIILWSDMSFEHEGEVELRFRVEVLMDTVRLGGLEFDPTDKNVTIGEVKSTIMNKTSWRFSGRNTKLDIKDDGIYTFRGILIASENPTLKVNKAEIVFKK